MAHRARSRSRSRSRGEGEAGRAAKPIWREARRAEAHQKKTGNYCPGLVSGQYGTIISVFFWGPRFLMSVAQDTNTTCAGALSQATVSAETCREKSGNRPSNINTAAGACRDDAERFGRAPSKKRCESTAKRRAASAARLQRLPEEVATLSSSVKDD